MVSKHMKSRKGFSLVELVVVILIIAILAVAVFAGGSAAIKKAQISRTTSDLHNFSVAIESALNETPSVANMKVASCDGASGDMQAIVTAINANLSADYQVKTTPIVVGTSDSKVTNSDAISVNTGNLKFDTLGVGSASNPTHTASHIILESAKTDAWDNHYYVILDFGERHQKGQSDFYVTVVSAGPNAQTTVGGQIESDDIFLLVQYSDGDVSSVTYNMDTDSISATANGADFDAKTKTGCVVKGTGGILYYSGGEDNTTYAGDKTKMIVTNF
jgi:prepilin-type N-terminal cleavage/methylation domain-containing protein